MNKNQNGVKLNAINAWRAAQGLEPLQSNGKTAKARAAGKQHQARANAAARAQANRDMKDNRHNGKRGK
jgi:hypothetical protein